MDENQVEQFQSPAPESYVPEQPVQQAPVYQQPPVQQPYYPQQPVYQQPPVQQPYYPQQPVYQQPPVQQPYYPQQPVYQQPPVQQPYYPQQPVYQQPAAPYPQYEQEPNWKECEESSFQKSLTSVILSTIPIGSIIGISMGTKGRSIAERAISYAKRHNIPVSGKTKAAAIMGKAGMIASIVFTALYGFILLILTNSY